MPINDPAALLAVLPTEDDAATTWRAKSSGSPQGRLFLYPNIIKRLKRAIITPAMVAACTHLFAEFFSSFLLSQPSLRHRALTSAPVDSPHGACRAQPRARSS